MTRSADSMPTPGEANAVRLLVVEDHPLFRDALVGVVATAFPDAEVFQAVSIDGALDVLASKGSVDVILLDLSMPGTTGLLGAFRVRVAAPKKRACHCLPAYDSARVVRCAMALGISGYIPKSTPKTELVQSIRADFAGGGLFPEAIPWKRGDPARQRGNSGPAASTIASDIAAASCSRHDLPRSSEQTYRLRTRYHRYDGQGSCHRDPAKARRTKPHQSNYQGCQARPDPIRAWRAGSRSCFGTCSPEPSRSLGQLEPVQQVITSIERRAGTASRLA